MTLESTATIGWIDASAGASGDMLLGALLDTGVPVEVIAGAVDAVTPEPVTIAPERVSRNGIAATRCRVTVADSTTHRTWVDVAALLDAAPLEEPVRTSAHAVFLRLATAEAAVHGTTPEQVHFHEVGALDAIADVVGVCAGFHHLGLSRLSVSPVAVGSGRTSAAHGSLPVPPPAVTELLRGAPSYAGPGEHESCTPTGAALLTTMATAFGGQPPMTVTSVGVGAGGRNPSTHPNVVRILLGDPIDAAATERPAPAVVCEANVDDLDPRLWPNVLAALLTAGASDAWLTPIMMKKGRPAHTLSVLVRPEVLASVRRVIFQQTSTIGVREVGYAKTALDREMHTVTVDGQPIAVKVARLDGEVMNLQPEYDDVVAVADATGRPVKDVLVDAVLAARSLSAGEAGPDRG